MNVKSNRVSRVDRVCWPCSVCGEDVEDGGGYVVVRYDGHLKSDREKYDAAERARQAADPRNNDPRWAALGTVIDLSVDLDLRPHPEYLALHTGCDASPDRHEYCWWHVERARSLRACIDWAAHLAAKSWIEAFDIHNFLRWVDSMPTRRVGPGPGVYCVRSGEFVKIGKSDKDVVGRVRELQTAHPEQLRLLGVLSDDPADEPKFHRRFAAQRTRGEWFRVEGELLSFLVGERMWKAPAA